MLRRERKNSKLLALMIAVFMLVTMIPSMAFAGENNAEDFPSSYGYDESDVDTVTAYVTISNDGTPLLGNDTDKTVMAHVKVEVPYFDLDKYDLSDYYRYETQNRYGEYVNNELVKRPTLLHLFIYVTEKYYLGLSEDKCGTGEAKEYLSHSTKDSVLYMDGTEAYKSNLGALVGVGSACSIYFNAGFWGHDENLNYYRNHRYPLMSEGWGATADYILLSDGDIIDVAMNTDWDKIFSGYFLSFNKDDYNTEAGEKMDVTVMGTARMAANGGKETEIEAFNEEIEVLLYDSDWNVVETQIEYDGANGYSIVMPETEGTYYILGSAYDSRTLDGVDAPAVAEVIVGDVSAPAPEPEQPPQPTEDELKTEAIKAAKVIATVKSAGYSKVNVSWNKVKDADKYEVYRATSKNGKYSKISTTTKTNVTNTKNVKTGKTYYYKVRALAEINGDVVYSNYSSVKSAKPVLNKVMGVKAKAGKKKVSVSWKKVDGATGYKIYRANSASGKYKVVKTIKSGKSVKWTNSKLKKGKTYRYKIKAYRTVDGKKVYSPSYSAVVKAKAK